MRVLYGGAALVASATLAIHKLVGRDEDVQSEIIIPVHELTTDARTFSADAIRRYMVVNGVPGVTVGVSVNGEDNWRAGFGYACVETGALCTPDTVMCIASISKSITAAIAARYVDDCHLNLDDSIYKYITPKDFPYKIVNGEKVDITIRQLLSHSAGIRHYNKNDCLKKENVENVENDENNENKKTNNQNNKKNADNSNNKNNDKKKNALLGDGQWSEFYLNKQFKSTTESLELFRDDALVAKPGERFYYTTHGYTLIASILEAAAGGRAFRNLLADLCSELGLNKTSVDEYTPICAKRARYYYRDAKTHQLKNIPQVNNSYKIAGGGIVSNVEDLLTFANVMLYSYQNVLPCSPKPFIKRETMKQLWSDSTPSNKDVNASRGRYGLGWVSVPESELIIGGVNPLRNSGYWYHTGAAVGASSILLIKPSTRDGSTNPKGVCVAILANCYGAHGGLVTLAREIAFAFEKEMQSIKHQ